MTSSDLPEYHFHRPPYPILSFLFGLYCDAPWSRAEFQKWLDSHDGRGNYSYDGYLLFYADMPAAAKDIISLDIPKSETVDEEGRRNPSESNSSDLWPHLMKELQKPPGNRPGDARAPYFTVQRPALSALACIYLGDAPTAESVLGMTRDESGRELVSLTTLNALIHLRAKRDAEGTMRFLEELKPALMRDFVSPPFCW